MALTDVVIDIHQRETATELSPEVIAELRDLADTYAIDEKRTWLDPIFEDVQSGRVVPTAVCFVKSGSDPYSYLVELVDLLGWKMHDEGEYQEIELRRLGMRIYISNEARTPDGRHASSYTIEPLSPT